MEITYLLIILIILTLLIPYHFITRHQMKKMEFKILSQDALIEVLGEELKEYQGKGNQKDGSSG